MKVTRLETTLLKFPLPTHAVPTYSVNPIHIFPDMQPGAGGGGGGNRPHMMVLQVETDEGIMGLANTNVATTAVQTVIRDHYAPLITGQDPFQTELLWEKMFRAGITLGRQGVSSIALSLIDIALWDIKGKAPGQPVYNLLGGMTKEKLRVYASRLYGPDTGRLAEEAAMYVEQGYTAVKQRLAFGPAHGIEGMKKNRELVETVRQTIGDDVELMVDCCRAFDPLYAIKMLRMIEEYDLSWVEEPVLPHDHEGYAQVRQAANMPISGGEHEYGRQAFRRWAEMGCADIWQPDSNRAGGITECQKIAHLGAAYGIPVIPHGGQVHNYHLIMANHNMTLAEYFPLQDSITDGNAFYWHAIEGEPIAESGYIEVSDEPGFGLKLNEEALAEYRYEG